MHYYAMPILVAFLIVYVGITEFLDWKGRMDLIEKFSPRLAKMVANRAFDSCCCW